MQEIHLLQDYVQLLADHDMSVASETDGLFLPASFDLGADNMATILLGFRDLATCLAITNPLHIGLSQMPIARGFLDEFSSYNSSLTGATWQGPLPPTLTLLASLSGGAPKKRALKRPAAFQADDPGDSSSINEAASSTIVLCSFIEKGVPCARPPQNGKRFTFKGVRYCQRHYKMVSGGDTPRQASLPRLRRRLCFKRPVAELTRSAASPQDLCRYVEDGVPCALQPRSEKRFQINGLRYCKRHAKMALRRRICLKRPAATLRRSPFPL